MAESETDAEDLLVKSRRIARLIVGGIVDSDRIVVDALAGDPAALAGEAGSDKGRAFLKALCRSMLRMHETQDDFESRVRNRLAIRFNALSIPQRMAFVLVVIEEISVEDAAEMLGHDIAAFRTLLVEARNGMFPE